MSFKKNIVANYIGQAYKALIGVVVMPLYLNYLGAEAYGLIGFFIMLQAWLQILDMGLRPTLAREASRYCASTISANDLRSLLHSMEVLFISIAIIFFLSIFINNIWIATKWLNIKSLAIEDVSNAIIIMGILVALRWSTSIYRGIISGFEQQVWLNLYDIISATFRYLGVLVVFNLFEASIYIFFIYQLCISIFEAIVILYYTYTIMPKSKNYFFSIQPIKNIYKFAIGIAFTSALWTGVTQIDKLILSNTLELAQYGYFTLAIVISSGIYILGNAIGTALMPRLTILSEKKEYHKLEYIYLLSREVSMIILVPISAMLVFFNYEIMYLITNDNMAAVYTSKIIIWYTLGNLALSMSAFGYYLQYTKGDLKLHIKGQIIFALFVIPLQYYMALNYGAIGTGKAWFTLNTVYLLFWIGIIHKKFLTFSHLLWLKEMSVSIFFSFIAVYLFKLIIDIQDEKKLVQIFILFGIWFVTLLITIVTTKRTKNKIQNYLKVRNND